MKLDTRTLCLDLYSVRSGSSSESFELPMEDIEWKVDDVRPSGPRGTLSLTVTARTMTWVCSGSLSAEFRTPCARCLEPVRFNIDAEVYRIFTWEEELATDLDTELISRNEGAVSILDAVREAVILSVPGMPLCRGDCRGLCVICGTNLNAADCEHSGVGPRDNPSESE
jgi:uncharacterized metal-binding protein YceD (DUF177 family)